MKLLVIELQLFVIVIMLLVGLAAAIGAYIIKEGINQAIAWNERRKEKQDNAEF